MRRSPLLTIVSVLATVVAACGPTGAATSPAAPRPAAAGAPAEQRAPAPSAPADHPLDEVVLRLAWTAGGGGDQPPFFLGLEKGWYREVGIDLKIIEGKGAAPNVQLLGNKSDLFSIIDANVLAASVSKGVPIKSIGTIVQQAPFDIAYRTDSGIKTLQDLRGKNVGFQPGEAQGELFAHLLQANGIDPRDVKVTGVAGANQPQALYQGQVDAVGGYVTGSYFRVKLGAPAGMQVDHIMYKDNGVSTLNASVAAHVDTLKDKPDLVRRFMAATTRALEYSKDHQDEAIAALLTQYPDANRELLTESTKWAFQLAQTPNSAGKPLGWTAEADWNNTLDLLQQFVGLTNREATDSYFTNDFIPAST